MAEAAFFRLLGDHDKANALQEAVAALRAGRQRHRAVHLVDPASFRGVPGSPFLYWVGAGIRRAFTTLVPFQSDGRALRQGLATADDFRFVRAWWEVPPDSLLTGSEREDASPEASRRASFAGKRWAPLAKGGEFAPFYADLPLVVDWERDGERLRASGASVIRNAGDYFEPGLTWPSRPHRRGAFACLPAGCLFSHTGMLLRLPPEQHWTVLALLNSEAYIGLLHLLMPRGGPRTGQTLKYELGYLAAVPLPPIPPADAERLAELALQCFDLRRDFERTDERSHLFCRPALLETRGSSLHDRLRAWRAREAVARATLSRHRAEIDEIAYRLYGFSGDDRRVIEHAVLGDQDGTGDDTISERPDRDLVVDLFSYAVGCAFGRWDPCVGLDLARTPPLPPPLAPPPAASPGMGPCPLAAESPSTHPLLRPRSVLVDAPDHPDDVVAGVRDLLQCSWGEAASAVEAEACVLLAVAGLRAYFRSPRGFFADHLRRYSQGRRKAPIYWLLQSDQRHFGLWLYAHGVRAASSRQIARRHVEPALIAHAPRGLTEQTTRAARRSRDGAPRGQPAAAFGAELRRFRDQLLAVADLGLTPDLNDGVLLTLAPWHAVVPWKPLRQVWQELLGNRYGWSSIARQLQARLAQLPGSRDESRVRHVLRESRYDGRQTHSQPGGPIVLAPDELIAAIERAGEEYAEFIEVQSDEAFHYRPAPDEWTAAELTGHVAEFPTTFAEQARKLSEQPGLALGRGLDDPGRLAAVAKLAGAEPLEAAALVRSGIQQAVASLQVIEPDGWQVEGQHRVHGALPVHELATRFILEHLRTHLEQARATVEASGQGQAG